ncbi:YlmC/YmxH family sporulation protein [Lentibacillus sp. L22]|uniref:YlmC/YmxH family sporulation protein n=1 Tax=Lentibacillus TaxID=175304 RepID=UPI0022B20AFF|nr:YlmC/YmxH family sporulation protein [Lentibacillus daqui]
MVTLSQLQLKEIISISDGAKLGHFTDLEIDGATGKITALIVPIKEKQSGFFGKADELIIYWSQIATIGADVILVKNVESPSLYPDRDDMEKR